MKTAPPPQQPVIPSLDPNDKPLIWNLFSGLTVGGAAPNEATGARALQLLDEVDAIVAKLKRDEKAKESKRDFLERKEDVRDELVETVQRLLEQGSDPSGVVAKADAIHDAYEEMFEDGDDDDEEEGDEDEPEDEPEDE